MSVSSRPAGCVLGGRQRQAGSALWQAWCVAAGSKPCPAEEWQDIEQWQCGRQAGRVR